MSAYKLITRHGHPNAYANGQIYEHIFVMSEMLKRPLTTLEVVHHKDENRRNNHPDNLQLFATDSEHRSYHKSLLAKERALLVSGNAEFRLCCYCKKYSDHADMVAVKGRHVMYHPECHTSVTLKTRATPEGKAAHNAASAKYRAKRKLSQQSIGI